MIRFRVRRASSFDDAAVNMSVTKLAGHIAKVDFQRPRGRPA
jgi:hypothetical protein